jgi:VIT1/CCC1 family predicted Fe2+/Mn2+ transporter
MNSRRVLDPVERHSEVLFGLIMTLTFTGTISVAEAGREEIRSMLTEAISCNIAWGLVDGVMYVIDSMIGRAREAAAPQAGAPTGGHSPRPGHYLRATDLRGAVGVFLLVVLATVPVVLPFVFVPEAHRALRLSNVIALAMLFIGGWSLARHTGLSRWRLGFGMLALGTALVLVTIALGG